MLRSIKHPITDEVFDLTKCVAPEIGVPPGRIVIFAGPAACGKSTVLHAAQREAEWIGFEFTVQDELDRFKADIPRILEMAARNPSAEQDFFAVEDAGLIPEEYAGCIIHLNRTGVTRYDSDIDNDKYIWVTIPSSTVLNLTVLKPEDAGEVPDVVELLEAALVRARKGEIHGVAVITVNNLRSISTAHSIGTGSCADLYFGAATLQARLLAAD